MIPQNLPLPNWFLAQGILPGYQGEVKEAEEVKEAKEVKEVKDVRSRVSGVKGIWKTAELLEKMA